MTDSLLALLGTLLLIERAILYLAIAQCATAVGVFVVALSLERFRRDLNKVA